MFSILAPIPGSTTFSTKCNSGSGHFGRDRIFGCIIPRLNNYAKQIQWRFFGERLELTGSQQVKKLRHMNGAVLANLRLIHRAAGFFWIGDSAYRWCAYSENLYGRERRFLHS